MFVERYFTDKGTPQASAKNPLAPPATAPPREAGFEIVGESGTFDQRDFDVRCEWGVQGVAVLGPTSDVVIVVDVLSFSTSVDVAVSRGAFVFPYRWRDETAQTYASSVGAIVAAPDRTPGKYSLSPASLMGIPAGTRLVIPSPNGATLALGAKSAVVLAGCLRNARAVATVAQKLGKTVAVIPAGERWEADASLRPSWEDLIGAGAIISVLEGSRSPEALAAVAAFREAEPHLESALRRCGSGKELLARGYDADVTLASQLNVSKCAPRLVDEAFRQADR